ncbi:MAG: AmmeMemoRadiSam system protein A [Sulfurimonas sp.]|jgi:AmmeMemoRadiSam system protein A|nr:AmmeMemoRadiSam system protein A [Sulfurimonadaceae bacterium]
MNYDILLNIAKQAILHHLNIPKSLDRDELLKTYPFLEKNGASFVTLNKDGSLRGCIGSIIAHQSLFDDIYKNATLAAFGDPRFDPLSVDELELISIEVSLLSEPKQLIYKNYDDLVAKLEPFKDGVILKHNYHQGTFLPQVWEQLPTTKEFLDHLAQKAGATPAIYKQNPTIYTYQVTSKERGFHEIL